MFIKSLTGKYLKQKMGCALTIKNFCCYCLNLFLVMVITSYQISPYCHYIEVTFLFIYRSLAPRVCLNSKTRLLHPLSITMNQVLARTQQKYLSYKDTGKHMNWSFNTFSMSYQVSNECIIYDCSGDYLCLSVAKSIISLHATSDNRHKLKK